MPALVAAVAVVLAAFAWSTWRSLAAPAHGAALSPLQDPAGHAFGERAEASRYKLLVFGYTSCPDVCPTTLAKLHGVLEQLGPAATRVGAVFVTVDPETDTPARLAAYAGAFDKRIVPLTGARAQLAAAARTIDAATADALARPGTEDRVHTGMIYLLDRGNASLSSYSPRLAAADIATDLLARLRASGPG